jgi:hypothetical protein
MRHLDDGRIAELIDTADRRAGGPADVEAHLAECAACRERVEEARRIAERARAILATAVPAVSTAAPIPSFEEVLYRAGRARRRASGLRIRSLAWAATVVIAGGLGWYARGELLDAGRAAAPVVAESGPSMNPTVPAEVPSVPPFTDSQVKADGRGGAAGAPAPVPSRTGQDSDRAREGFTPVANRREADQVGKAATTPPAQPPARSDEAERLALRQAAPPAAEPAPVAGALAPELRRQVAAEEDRLVLTGQAAERVLGGRVASVDGLPIETYYRLPTEPDVVYTEQRLPDGRVLRLQQQRLRLPRAAPPPAPMAMVQAEAARKAEPAAASRDSTTVVSVDTVEVGGLRVIVRGAVPADSLRELVRRIRR